MAQEVINVGSTANDGTGDTLRAAFIKVNTNFTTIGPMLTLGTSLQGVRVNLAGTALEYYSPTTDPATTVGDMIQLASISPNVYGRLAAVATGNVIISGGTGTVSSWGKVGLATHVSGTLPVANGGTGTTTGLPVNNLIAATATNTINHATFGQVWQWNTFAGGNMMLFQSTSTAAASGTQTLVNIALSGANSNSGQETWALSVTNTHTGTSSTNRAGDFGASGGAAANVALRAQATGTSVTNTALVATASGGTNNYAAILTGRVGIGTTAPTFDLQINAAAATSVGLTLSQNDVAKAVIGTAGTSNQLITGSASGDLAIRTSATQKILFSVDGGTSALLIVGGTSSTQVAGSFGAPYVAKTALYTLTALDYTVEVTSGTHTQTLPTAVGCAGRIYVITNSGSGTVTVGTTSSQTFVNVTATPTTLTLLQFNTVILQSNGANWLRLTSI